MGSKEKRAASRGSGKRSANKINRAIRLQYGVLPYRFTETNSLEVLLVTTRQTRRWIIPKGWPIKGLKPPKSSAREAYEEAGIRGTVGAKSVWVFSYEKLQEENSGAIPCEVRVFPMIVKRQLDTWSEAHEREARWFEPVKETDRSRNWLVARAVEDFVVPPPELQKVGDCAITTITRITARIEGTSAHDTGSAIVYANGVAGVSYEYVPPLHASRMGDQVRLCLVSIFKNYPPGDDAGQEYQATNLRTGNHWASGYKSDYIRQIAPYCALGSA
jgi:8-oxo-dGTP pyrophosphatase MutT (NUDIX family)